MQSSGQGQSALITHRHDCICNSSYRRSLSRVAWWLAQVQPRRMNSLAIGNSLTAFSLYRCEVCVGGPKREIFGACASLMTAGAGAHRYRNDNAPMLLAVRRKGKCG